MSEKTFIIGNKAAELMQYTITITSNKKRYPPKYKMLIERIQNKCMDIYEYLIEANRLDLNLYKKERKLLQTKAITTCDKLSKFIEISINLNLIGTDTAAYWQKKINDVKYMTISWQNSDRK